MLCFCFKSIFLLLLTKRSYILEINTVKSKKINRWTTWHSIGNKHIQYRLFETCYCKKLSDEIVILHYIHYT